jgi:hypothetical protein
MYSSFCLYCYYYYFTCLLRKKCFIRLTMNIIMNPKNILCWVYLLVVVLCVVIYES